MPRIHIKVQQHETAFEAFMGIASGVWFFYRKWTYVKVAFTLLFIGFVGFLTYDAYVSGKASIYDIAPKQWRGGETFTPPNTTQPQSFHELLGGEFKYAVYMKGDEDAIVIDGKYYGSENKAVYIWKLKEPGAIFVYDTRTGLKKGIMIPELKEYEEGLTKGK